MLGQIYVKERGTLNIWLMKSLREMHLGEVFTAYTTYHKPLAGPW